MYVDIFNPYTNSSLKTTSRVCGMISGLGLVTSKNLVVIVGLSGCFLPSLC